MSAPADFSWSAAGNGRVLVRWRGRRVKVLTGAAARRFLDRVEGADAEASQLEMARVTGNFKRGNERR